MPVPVINGIRAVVRELSLVVVEFANKAPVSTADSTSELPAVG